MESEDNDMEMATNVRDPQNVGLLEIAEELKKTNELLLQQSRSCRGPGNC